MPGLATAPRPRKEGPRRTPVTLTLPPQGFGAVSVGRRLPSRRSLGPARQPQEPPGPPAGLQPLPCGPGKPRQRSAASAASTAGAGAGRGRGPPPAPSHLRAEGLSGAGPRRLIHWPRARPGAGGREPGAAEPGARDGDWFRRCPGPGAGVWVRVRVRVTTLPRAGRTHRGRLRPAALPPPRLPASAHGPASARRRSGHRVSMMEPARPTPRAPRHRWLRSAERPAACVSCACACASGPAARLPHPRAALCAPAPSSEPRRASLAAGRSGGRGRGCGPDSWVVGDPTLALSVVGP